MAVKAKDSITVYHVIDIDSTTWYYNLQPSTATPPAKPTTDPPPSPWVTTEPTYTEGATNSLYVVEKTVFSDGSFEYTDVSLSSSYEAAKTAYNKSVVALNTAVSSATTATKYIVDVTNGVFVHADGTPDDPTNANAKGVLIQDDVRIIIGGTAVAKYGSSIEIGTNANTKITIDGTNGLKIGNKIQLDTSGNASFTGKITSTSGNIGGWDISNFQIVYKTQITVDSTVYDSQVYMRAKGGSDGSAATASTHAFGVQHKLPSETNWTNDFVVRHDGYMYARNANVSGQITAISGKIGEFTLSNGTLSHTSGNYTITLRNVQTGHPEYGVFYITDSSATDQHPFRINGDGSIKATKGTIGGWTISDHSISSVNGTKGTGLQIPSSGTWAIAVGYDATGSTWGTAPFRVNHEGKMYATGAEISGKITAQSGTIGNFTVSTTENTGTSANGGHFYTNSLYAHSGDDTYEYEVGIKGDGNNTSAGYGNVAFYVKRITKGAAWRTGVNTFYITKSGQFAVIGAKTQVLIDPRATNVFRIQKYANNAWSNVIYMDANGDAHFTGTITGSAGEFTKSFYMGVPKNLTGAVDTNTIWVDNNTFWFVKRIKPTNSNQYIIGGMSVETSTSNNKPYTNIYGQEIHLISDGTVVIESDFKILNGTVKSNITSEGTFVGKTISGHTNRTMVGSQSNDGQRVGMIRCTSTSQAGIASQNGTAGSSYAWRNFSVSSSDIRLKKNVKDCEVDSALDVINQIKMRSFDWLHTDEHQHIGFIADELEEIDPHLSMGGGTERDGTVNYKSVDTFYLMGYLVKSIQELSKELKALKGEVA